MLQLEEVVVVSVHPTLWLAPYHLKPSFFRHTK